VLLSQAHLEDEEEEEGLFVCNDTNIERYPERLRLMTRMRPAKRGCFEHRHGFFSLAIDILS